MKFSSNREILNISSRLYVPLQGFIFFSFKFPLRYHLHFHLDNHHIYCEKISFESPFFVIQRLWALKYIPKPFISHTFNFPLRRGSRKMNETILMFFVWIFFQIYFLSLDLGILVFFQGSAHFSSLCSFRYKTRFFIFARNSSFLFVHTRLNFIYVHGIFDFPSYSARS